MDLEKAQEEYLERMERKKRSKRVPVKIKDWRKKEDKDFSAYKMEGKRGWR